MADKSANGEFLDKIDKGKGIAQAREAGYEMVDLARMTTLLADLDKERVVTLDPDTTTADVAVRAMAILRG